MDVYGQITIDLVMLNGDSIESAYKKVNTNNVKDTYLVVVTDEGEHVVFKKREIKNVDVVWDAEYDDEVC